MNGERYVLALDTATAPGGVAVGAGGVVLAEVVLGIATRHSELLIPAIDFTLRIADVGLDEVDAIVCGAGPGSFTGVRIAAATAKGLAHARGVPLYACSSLLASAVAAGAFDRPVCALFDARRGEAYAGCWGPAEPGIGVLLEPTAGLVTDIVASLGSHDPLYTGDGADRNRQAVERAGGRVTVASHGCAGALIRLCAGGIGCDRVPDPAHWEPTYMRAPNVTLPA